MKVAMLFSKLNEGKVQCRVCEHHCVIPDGHRGICGVRQNVDGVLYALNYGKTISAAIDPIEKKPLYHFLPHSKIYSFATMGCNMRCSWCQNWDISQSSKPTQLIEGEEISPLEHVNRAIASHCPSIAYTYSEPTIFLEYALDTMKIAKEKGLKNVWVTNGFMSKETLNEIIPYLDAANVDLKGANNDVYGPWCGASIQPIIDNLIIMKNAGVHLEITTLVIPGVNSSVEQLTKIANTIFDAVGGEVPWHISRFFPAFKMAQAPITSIPVLHLARKIGHQVGLNIIHLGNV